MNSIVASYTNFFYFSFRLEGTYIVYIQNSLRHAVQCMKSRHLLGVLQFFLQLRSKHLMWLYAWHMSCPKLQYFITALLNACVRVWLDSYPGRFYLAAMAANLDEKGRDKHTLVGNLICSDI